MVYVAFAMCMLCIHSDRQLQLDHVCVGIVGEADEKTGEYFMWTHKKLEIGYNKNQIVDINLTSDNKVKLEPNKNIHFTYEVIAMKVQYHSYVSFKNRSRCSCNVVCYPNRYIF